MLLERQQFFVREQVAVMKLTDTYDILDPATQELLGQAKEEPASWAKWLRLLLNKQMMPTRVNVYEAGNSTPIFAVASGWFRHRNTIMDATGAVVGEFKSKMFSLGGAFRVLDATGQQFAEVKGDWKGWNFRFLDSAGNELGVVTKKWAGLGRELFTSADQYIISLNEPALQLPGARVLLLAAGLAIDIVFKERS